MVPQKKTRTELELEVARMNANDLRSFNQFLSKQLDEKDFEILRKDQEIDRLKTLTTIRDAKPLESTLTEAISHTHPGKQLTDRQERRHQSTREQHSADATRTESTFSLKQNQCLKALQKILEDTEKEKEGLQRMCLEKDNRIKALKVELTRVLHENEIQHSKLEDCLEEGALLSRRYDHLAERHERLQAESTKIAGSKRSLAVYLSDIGFSHEDFMAESAQQGPKASPSKDDSKDGDTNHGQTATPVKSCAATPAVIQLDSVTVRTDFSMANSETSHEKDTSHGNIDDDTIVVARKVKAGTVKTTSQMIQPSIEVEYRDANPDEDEQTDTGDDDNNDGGDDGGDDDDDDDDIDVAAEETAFDSETDAASEYDPRMDWEGGIESDGDLTSDEDSDYAL